jgi:hypothetical protein
MDFMAAAQLLGNFGEFVGSLVVLVTVIYLAIQVRQTRLSVQSSSWQNGVNRIIDWNFRLAEDVELLDVFQRGLSDPDRLTSQEQLRLSLVLASVLQQFHKWYLDNEKGLVEEAAWLGEADSMVAILSSPGGARWWRQFEVPFTPGFRAYVDGRLRDAQTAGHFRYRFDNALADNPTS